MSEKKKVIQIISMLEQVLKDTSVPKNIRKSAEDIKTILLNEKEDMSAKVSSAIYILEEISNDRNLPMHARTLIWNIASELETVKF